MKETASPKEIPSEQNRLENLSKNLGANAENFSVAQTDQKLSARLDIGVPAEYSAAENLDKKTVAMKKEINELLAERYHTSPEFEELRSKNKLGRLSTFEKIQYAYLARQYPERAKISASEQRRTNLAYEDAKRYKIDFQIVDALRFYKAEREIAKNSGHLLNLRESDLYDKLTAAYAEKIAERADEIIDRMQSLLLRT